MYSDLQLVKKLNASKSKQSAKANGTSGGRPAPLTANSHSVQRAAKKQKRSHAPPTNGTHVATTASATNNKKQHTNGDDKPRMPVPSSPVNGHHLAFNTELSSTVGEHQLAHKVFEWLIWPLTVDDFFSKYYEKKPFIVHRHRQSNPSKIDVVTVKHSPVDAYEWYAQQRESGQSVSKGNRVVKHYTNPSGDSSRSTNSEHYYEDWFTKSDIDTYLHSKNPPIQYGTDIDVTSYKDFVRSTHNGTGRAKPKDVWQHYNEDGCSIRFVCPHKFSSNVHRLINLCDLVFGMGVGANTYLTPASTQGFAPHYDDVDVLVLQTEGSKRWRLYAPRNAAEILPQFSSRNFSQDEIGEPIVDVVLEEGDFLYAPRGTIHQCVASPNEHSLHVTLSTALKTSWSEYLTHLLPAAAQAAFKQDIAFRRTLPRNYHQYMGVQHDQESSHAAERKQMLQHTVDLLQRMLNNPEALPVDDAADVMALTWMGFRVPPAIEHRQIKTLQQLIQSKKLKSAEELPTSGLIKPTTRLRLVQPEVGRIVIDKNAAVDPEQGELVQFYHTASNSREHLTSEQPECLDFSINLGPALELILKTHPLYIAVESLPLPAEQDEDGNEIETSEEEDNELRCQLVCKLFEEGVIEVSNSQQIEDSAQQLMTENEADDAVEQDDAGEMKDESMV